MSSLNIAHDYTDFDEILDVGDSDAIVHGDLTEPGSSAIYYDDSYVEDLSHLCSENSEVTHQHYQAKIKLQHDLLLRHNDDGLLEALRRSMENFESSTMSDLASLSSSLDLALPGDSFFTTSNNLIPDDFLVSDQQSTSAGTEESSTTPDDDEEEEEQVSVDGHCEEGEGKCDGNDSMLKQLLLNPNNDYRKEVDANSTKNDEPIEKVIVANGSRQHKRQSRKIKKKLPQKPFTELLKHLESPNNQLPRNSVKSKTRVLNAKKYMRQYGSAPASRVGSPEPDALTNPPKRTVLKPPSQKSSSLKSSKNSTVINPKKPLQVTKVYPIAPSPLIGLKTNKSIDKTIVAPDLNTLLDMFENEPLDSLQLATNAKDADTPATFQPSSGKRKGTLLIEPLPKKRHRASIDDAAKKQATDPKNGKLSCHTPSLDHDYCQHYSLSPGGVSLNDKSTNTTKVLHWEEYLKRIRSGTRSAPNSPASSPKPNRGSSRKSSAPKPAVALAKPVQTTATLAQVTKSSGLPSPHVTPIIAAKIQANTKPTIRLQEFKEYLANLKSKHSNQFSSTPSAEIVASSTSSVPRNAVKFVQASLPTSTASIPFHLASRLPVVQQSKQIAPSQPFIKVQSGGKIHTAAVTSSQTLPQQSGPLVMIRIPVQSNCSTLQQKGPRVVSPPVVTTAKLLPTTVTPLCISKSTPVNASSPVKTKRVTKNSKSSLRSNRPVVHSGDNLTGAETSSPTFKLITSGKSGSQSKSLILSNVTGQLKEILTALAHQQQGDKTDSSSSNEQQKTLQQLLAAITNMKKPPTETRDGPTSGRNTSSATPPTKTSTTGLFVQPSTLSPNGQAEEPVVTSGKTSESTHCPETLSSVLPGENYFSHADRVSNSGGKAEQLSQSDRLPAASNRNRQSTSDDRNLESLVESSLNRMLDAVVENCRRTAGVLAQPSNHTESVDSSMAAVEATKSTRLASCFNSSTDSPLVNVDGKTETCGHVASNGTSNTTTSPVACDSIENGDTTQEEVSDGADEDRYYNKLPAYLYSGKVLDTEDVINEPSVIGGEHCIADNSDIGCEVELQNIEYNKLPHYFSSGKLAPSEETASAGHTLLDGIEPEAITFSSDVVCTPEGKVIDPSDTFYSRLPSYFNYGRTHIVDTVTEPPCSCDDTVTGETLRQLEEEKRMRLEEQQRRRAEKKREREKEKSISDDRILYSKIPSYLLSGHKPLAPERNPHDSFYPSSQSSSSDSEGAYSSSSRGRTKRLKRDRVCKVRKKDEDESKKRAILERRVMYVGGIDSATTKPHLRSRFEKFGPIDDVTLHFRRGKDNYAFVTYRYSNDVIQAIDRGNEDVQPRYTLCFGGRRHFCKVDYADLDEDVNGSSRNTNDDDFDTLLRQAMRR